MSKDVYCGPSIRARKIAMPRVEWEKVLVLGRSDKDNSYKSTTKKKKKPRYIGEFPTSHESLLRLFDEHYSPVRWNLYGTLGFYFQRIQLSVAQRAFDKWSRPLLVSDGEHGSWCLRVTEHRQGKKNFRFHIFFKNTHLPSKHILISSWEDVVWGKADLWRVTRGCAVNDYLRAATQPDSRFEIEECDF
jgi:hypothetical protein